jgi:prevent-host-death family protein
MTDMTRRSRPASVAFDIDEARARFPELVSRAMLGEEVLIALDNRPVLRLVPVQPAGEPRRSGTARSQVAYVAPDFDATPAAFASYR